MEFIIFSGSACHNLTDDICKLINCKKGKCMLGNYHNGETKIKIHDSVRNKCVFIIQSITSTETKSVNDVLMELYLFIRTVKRASAAKVIIIIPYFGYSRQYRKTESIVPISASDVAILLETAGANRIVTLELRCGQIQGFFRDIPCDNIHSSCLLTDAFVSDLTLYKKNMNNLVVVSPDAGGVSRANAFKQTLSKIGIHTGFAILVNERDIDGNINTTNLIGDVIGKDVVIVDDVCDTGGTLLKAINELKKLGVNDVYVCITHPVFSGDSIELIKNSPIIKMFVTDTIYLKDHNCHNIKQITTATLLSKVIRILIHGGSSINPLVQSDFEMNNDEQNEFEIEHNLYQQDAYL
jgi:ribose-phosphate pyrophosphokinase